MTHTSSTHEGSTLLDVASVLRWAHGAAAALERARLVIDRANVFPVPDADTGTNLAATLTQARDAAVAEAATGTATAGPETTGAPTTDDVLHALAHGALLGARGSSGVIMSEFLRGFAQGHCGFADGHGVRAGGLLAQALACGADSALAAVVDPRPGTMLTAARGAADSAASAVADGGSLPEVLLAARSGADDALRRSVDELDELRRAGVLDAGAYGFVLVLGALCEALGLAPSARGEAETLSVAGEQVEPEAGPHRHGSAVDGEFEVMCVVRHTAAAGGASDAPLDEVAPVLRSGLQQLGDSVVVVGGPDRGGPARAGAGRTGADRSPGAPTLSGTWQVHVHTDHPVEVLRLLDRWEVGQVVVRCLAHQVAVHDPAAHDPAAHAGATEVGLVACTSAPGLVMDLARSGAVVVLRGSGPVERDDLLRAVHETDAEHVVVLPADPATLALAGGLVDLPRPQVTVVGSTSDLHVVAALSSWVSEAGDDSTPLAARTAGLSDVVTSVRAVQLDAARPAGIVEAVSRLLAGDTRTVDRSVAPVAPIVPHATTTPTVVTVLAGDLVPANVLADLLAHAERLAPGLETVVLPSGRRSTELVIGAEPQ